MTDTKPTCSARLQDNTAISEDCFMPCPTCDHTMHRVEQNTLWCPRCGTLASQENDGTSEAPMLVKRCRDFEKNKLRNATLLLDQWRIIGIAESINRPENQKPNGVQPMTKHSPGPWEAYLPGRKFVVSKRNFNHLAELNEEDRDRETVIANAYLMAAAPDLLEALQELYDEQRGPLTEAMKKAQAAIAKAKSEAI